MFTGKVKSDTAATARVTIDDGCFILPYTQTEAIHTFLRCYHRDFLAAAHRRLEAVLTNASETVGGSVDVAIITRPGGFMWWRHKSLGAPAQP